MTLKVLNLIYWIHKAPLQEEALNKIAFTTVYCTHFTYEGNILLLYFIVRGFFSYYIYPFL